MRPQESVCASSPANYWPPLPLAAEGAALLERLCLGHAKEGKAVPRSGPEGGENKAIVIFGKVSAGLPFSARPLCTLAIAGTFVFLLLWRLKSEAQVVGPPVCFSRQTGWLAGWLS